MTRLSTPLKRRTRRLLSVAAVFLLALTFFVGSFGEQVYTGFGIFPLIPYLFVLVWLNGSTACIATSKDSKLDERQKALRDRAYRLTYSVFVAFALFLFLADIYGVSNFHITFGVSKSSIITLLLMANLFLLSASPILYVAWLEPDPIQENELRSLHEA